MTNQLDMNTINLKANPDYPFGVGNERNRIDHVQFTDYIGRMDPMMKEIWITALLTEFAGKQGHKMLQTPDGKFCCLGVYCEVKGIPQFKEPQVTPGDEDVVNQITTYGTSEWTTSYTFIPVGHEIQLSLKSEDYGFDKFAFNGGSELFSAWTQNEDGDRKAWAAHTLTQMNDDGFTFPQIADVIRYFL